MLCGRTHPGSNCGSNCKRNLDVPSRHIAQFGGLVHDLIHTNSEKADVHKLSDRPKSRQCGTERSPDESRLGNGSIDDSLRSKLLNQSLCDPKRSAPSIDLRRISTCTSSQIFPDENHTWVFAHHQSQALIYRLTVSENPVGGHWLNLFALYLEICMLPGSLRIRPAAINKKHRRHLHNPRASGMDCSPQRQWPRR